MNTDIAQHAATKREEWERATRNALTRHALDEYDADLEKFCALWLLQRGKQARHGCHALVDPVALLSTYALLRSQRLSEYLCEISTLTVTGPLPQPPVQSWVDDLLREYLMHWGCDDLD